MKIIKSNEVGSGVHWTYSPDTIRMHGAEQSGFISIDGATPIYMITGGLSKHIEQDICHELAHL